MNWRTGVAALVLCAAGGCASSPQVTYFSLAPIDRGAERIAGAPAPVQVVQVHLPPSLDRREMVRLTGSYSLQISDEHRWAAPLDEMTRRVLSQDLMQLLPPGTVVLPQAPAPQGTRKIVVNILQFAPDAAGTVQLQGSWTVVAADAHSAPESHAVQLSSQASATEPADQVRAMSEVLEELAQAMVKALQP